MPNKNPLWVSSTTTLLNPSTRAVTVSGEHIEQPAKSLNVQELALLLNSKHRNNTYKGYSADSIGGSYEGL